jgi:hypothetical protein
MNVTPGAVAGRCRCVTAPATSTLPALDNCKTYADHYSNHPASCGLPGSRRLPTTQTLPKRPRDE